MGWFNNLLDFHKGVASGAANIFTGSKNRKMAKDQFNAQMDQSVQRRVADAKAAGIHPLAALGASVGGSPTTSWTDNTAQNIAAAYGAMPKGKKANVLQDKLIAMQTQQAQSAIGLDAAQAAYYDSLAAKTRQDMYFTGRDYGVKALSRAAKQAMPGVKTSSPNALGPVKGVLPEVKTAQPGSDGTTVAGLNPLWKDTADISGYDMPVIDDTAAQADMTNDALISYGLIKNRRNRAYNKKHGNYRVYNPKTGKWDTYRQVRKGQKPGETPFQYYKRRSALK